MGFNLTPLARNDAIVPYHIVRNDCIVPTPDFCNALHSKSAGVILKPI